MWTPEIDQMLDNLEKINQYDEKRKLQATCIVERMLVVRKQGGYSPVKGTSKHFGPGKWNQKRTRFECSCGGCGKYLEIGTLCWVTVEQSPRCLDCGKPPETVETTIAEIVTAAPLACCISCGQPLPK